MKKILVAFLLTVALGFAKNPICDNEDKSRVFYYKCFSFGEDQFVSVKDGMPTFSDGTDMGSEGSSRWNNVTVRLCSEEKTYTKNGIVFSVCPIGAFSCQYEVFKTDEVTIGDVDFRDDGEYLINYYDCKYESTDVLDTTYAQTDLQKRASMADLLGAVIRQDVGDFGEWKIYREDGTLKFVGSYYEGYCMSKNGMKQTKKVANAMFCK